MRHRGVNITIAGEFFSDELQFGRVSQIDYATLCGDE
jgi:hypothetical protein